MLLSRFKVVGHSMEPFLGHGSFVLVSNIPYLLSEPRIGDIVLLKHKQCIIKRISKIDKNKIFVEGENKKASTDSRDFGWISKKEILGKVILKI